VAERGAKNSENSELLRSLDAETMPYTCPHLAMAEIDDIRARTYVAPSGWLTASDYSLKTLSSYIQSQRCLLSRTRFEIERFYTLEKYVNGEEDLTFDDILTKRHDHPPDSCGLPWIDVLVAHP